MTGRPNSAAQIRGHGYLRGQALEGAGMENAKLKKLLAEEILDAAVL